MTVSDSISSAHLQKKELAQGSRGSQNLWYNEILEDSPKIPKILQEDINRISNQLMNYPYSHEYRKECFLEAMGNAQIENLPLILFYLISNPETQESLVNLMNKTDLCQQISKSLKSLLYDGEMGDYIGSKLLSYGLQITEADIIETYTAFIANVCGRFVQVWFWGQQSSSESCNEIVDRFKPFLEMMLDFRDSTRVSIESIVNCLTTKYESSLKNIFCIPKNRNASHEDYFNACFPLMLAFSKSKEGVQFFQKIIEVYASCDEYDHQAFIKMIFFDQKPCEFKSRYPFKKFFGKKFSTSPICRKFVLKTTCCIVPLIAEVNKCAPELSFKYNWQDEVNEVFDHPSNVLSMNIPKIKNVYKWAMHFAETPSDLSDILDHDIDLKTLVTRFFESELLNKQELFELMFDMVMTSSELLELFFERFPEQTTRLLERKMDELCCSYLRPPISQKQISKMQFFIAPISISYHLEKEKRSVKDTMKLMGNSISSRNCSDVFKALKKALAHYTREEKVCILVELIKNLEDFAPCVVMSLFNHLDQEILTIVVSKLWQGGVLTKSFFNEIFPFPTRNPLFPGYLKFIEAVNAHMEKDIIREKLEIERSQGGVIVLDRESCVIQ